jgi:hypothetical protein
MAKMSKQKITSIQQPCSAEWHCSYLHKLNVVKREKDCIIYIRHGHRQQYDIKEKLANGQSEGCLIMWQHREHND